ncbi:WD40 repeat domain-containing protein [uncultured Nostoc sp.]|uniref:WD40 repeat domain-containing protein n=1 Tax=uncultured Nostoc sp. TaxID=340711 RepID=UPI0035C9E8EE
MYSVSFSPDGQTIASGSWDGTIKLWKKDGTLITTLSDTTQSDDGLLSENALVSRVSFSPDGQMIASIARFDKTVKLWKRDGTPIKTLRGHKGTLFSVSFSPDGQTFASGDGFGNIKLWKRDGTPIKTLRAHNDAVWSISFSPDGQTFASASGDKTIKLWKKDGTPIKTLSGHY